MPAPMSADIVERVRLRLLQGDATHAKIAEDLQVSETYVRQVKTRLKQGGDGTHAPMGGARYRLCSAENLRRLAGIVQQHPKITLAQLAERGRELRLFNTPPWLRDAPADEQAAYMPNVATLSKVLGRMGMSFQAAQFVDPVHVATEDDAAAALDGEPVNAARRRKAIGLAEREELRAKQRTPGHIVRDPSRLMFMDESTFALTEQARRAWGGKNDPPTLPKRKGLYESYTLLLTIAPGAAVDGKTPLVSWELRDPENIPEEPYIQEDDKRTDPGPVQLGINVATADVAALRAELARHGLGDVEAVELVGGKVVSWRPLTRPEMQARLRAAAEQGKVNLPIRADLRPDPRQKRKERIRARTVAVYLAEKVARTDWTRFFGGDRERARQDLERRCLVWDNAVHHMAVGAKAITEVSWWHSHIRQLVGIGNVLFLPSRSPGLNPCETAFAYIKADVRRNCPDTGQYADREALRVAIKQAIDRITPDMVLKWVRSTGFGMEGAPPRLAPRPAPKANPCADPADATRQRHAVVCATPAGRVVRIKPAGSVRWQAKAPAAAAVGQPLIDVANARLRDIRAAKQLQRDRKVAAALAPPAQRRWPGPLASEKPAGRKVMPATGRPTYLEASAELLKRLNAYRVGRGYPALSPDGVERSATSESWWQMPRPQAGDEQRYEVERLLDVKKEGGRLYALVKWKNYPDSENTWEPFTQLEAWRPMAEAMWTKKKRKD
jgi:transposase